MDIDAEPDEVVDRPAIAVGHDFPDSHELAEHRHQRSQFLYAATGVMAVSTPNGAWVAPPERAVWIPAGTPHSVRMVGAVRSEEHTSELQSLRRISYAVFSLKTKN